MGGKIEMFYNGVSISVVDKDTEAIATNKLASGIYVKQGSHRCVSYGVGRGAVQHSWNSGDVAFVTIGGEFTVEYPNNDPAHMCIEVPERILLSAANDESCMKREIHRLNDQTVVQLVNAFSSLGADPDPLVVDHLTMALCYRASSWFEKKKPANNNNADRISRSIEFANDNLRTPMKISDLASAACMSAFHFARQFRRVTGRTPIRYVMEKRVEKAKQLLSYSAKSVTEIAHDCGFASQAHMSTAFKSHTGITPSEYKQQILPR